MKKQFFGSFLIILITTILTGCGQPSMVAVPKPQHKVMEDSEKAYVSFSRSNSFFGAAIPNIISNFDYESKKIKNVGTLYPGDRVIFPVDAGKNHFYLTGGENDDYIEVNTLKNHIYYVNTYVSVGILMGRVYFDKYDLSKEEIEKINSSKLLQPTIDGEKRFIEAKNDYWKEIEEDQDQWRKSEKVISFSEGLELKDGQLLNKK